MPTIFSSISDLLLKLKKNVDDDPFCFSYTTHIMKTEDICGICLFPMDHPLDILQCHHSFHRECIMKWYQYKLNCPLCRRGADEEDQERRGFIRVIYMVEFCFFMLMFSIWVILLCLLFFTSIYRYMHTMPAITTFPVNYSCDLKNKCLI